MLHDLRDLCAVGSEDIVSKDRLGVKELDHLLDVFMPVPAAQHPSRQPQSSSLPQAEDDLLFSGDEEDIVIGHQARFTPVSRPNPVVEISSSSSAAGKSQLLYYLTAITILPLTYEGARVDGKESAVVFIDADGRFDADRLRTVARGILHRRLRDQPETIEPAHLEAILLTSLQHVHVLRPQSSSSLLATFHSLDTYLFDLSRHVSSNRRLHAIIIDSASAFFWQDRLRDEVARIEDIGRPLAGIEREREQKQSFYISDLYAELVKELKRLQRRFSCAIIFTTTSLTGKTSSSHHTQSYQTSGPFDLYNPPAPPTKTPALRPFLPAPWGTFPTLRLVVQRDAVRPFPPNITVHNAERDAANRHEVVKQGKFSGWVNGWGQEEWPSRVVDGIDGLNGGMFVFYARSEGVDIPR